MAQDNKPELVVENVCPVCGSTERLCDPFVQEMKDKGWMRPEFNYYPQIWQSAVYDKTLLHKIPIGSTVPAYHIYVGVCMGWPNRPCGCIYAVKIEKSRGTYTGEIAQVKGQEIDIPDAIKKAFEDNKP